MFPAVDCLPLALGTLGPVILDPLARETGSEIGTATERPSRQRDSAVRSHSRFSIPHAFTTPLSTYKELNDLFVDPSSNKISRKVGTRFFPTRSHVSSLYLSNASG